MVYSMSRSSDTVVRLDGGGPAIPNLHKPTEQTARAIDETESVLRTIESDRFVTGVTWVEANSGTAPGRAGRATFGASIRIQGRFWSASPCLPVGVSGLEADEGSQFFCGGGNGGKVRAVRRPKWTR
jgi:hypothetical protein